MTYNIVMKWVLIFILIIPNAKSDDLLDAIYGKWDKIELYEKDDETNNPEIPESSYFEDAEVYHWELGTPDNIPEIEIIYDEPSPCQL